jgi:hypothetical protein
MVSEDRPSAGELFNSALESFLKREIEFAVTCLRAAFFENLYIAPSLIGEEYYPQNIWYSGADAEPEFASQYVARYGQLWRESDDSLVFLAEVWRDPVVRRELESYISLSKAILQAPDESSQAEYMGERLWFLDQRRIRGTQGEILSRLQRAPFQKPIEKPRFDSVHLASHEPATTVDFFRDLFQIEPVRTSRRARGYAEFEMPGARLVIHGHDRLAPGDPYRLGPPPSSLGWGVIFLLRVSEFDRYYENAGRARIVILDSDLTTPGERFFLVKEPSGYLIEISE